MRGVVQWRMAYWKSQNLPIRRRLRPVGKSVEKEESNRTHHKGESCRDL